MKDTKNIPYSRIITFATLVVIVVILKVGKQALIPFSLALMFSFVMAPLVLKLQRLGLPRSASVLIVVFFAVGSIAVLGSVLGHELVSVAEDLPKYKDTLRAKIETLKTPLGSSLGKTGETVDELDKELSKSTHFASPQPEATRVQVVSPTTSSLQTLRSVLVSMFEPFTNAAIVIVFVVFMLLKKEDLRDRFVRLLGRGQLHITTQALNDVAHRLSQHLSMLLLVNCGIAVAVMLGLFAIGIPNAALWGAFAGVLRFIPFVGIWIAAAFPAILSIAVFHTWWPFLFVTLLFVALEILVANFVEPWLYGSHTGVSSIALVGAAVFWTWLWGTPGLFVATPLTVCLVVMGKYIPQLQFLDILLGDEPVLDPSERFYQRLIGMNSEEARESLREFMEKNDRLSVYDNLLLPVLIRSQQDFDQGGLDSEQHDTFLEDFAGIVQAELRSIDANKKGGRSSVLCLPAYGQADEIAAELFVKAAAEHEISAAIVSSALLSEIIDEVAKHAPAAVVISALPPSAILHVSYITNSLRSRFPQIQIVVGLWKHKGNSTADTQVESAAENSVALNFSEAIHQLTELMHVAA